MANISINPRERVLLRNMHPQDDPFLFQVYASTRAEEMIWVPWTTEQKNAFLHMQFNTQRQQYQITYPNAIDQIIEFNGIPAGRLIVDRSVKETALVDIALLPEFRNRGLGTYLISNLQAEEKKITLHVIKSNPAVNLYQRLGFIFVEEESLYAKMEWSPQGTGF